MKGTNTASRLKQIMKELNLKQVDIVKACEPYCEKYGVKLAKNDVSQYVSGKVTPGQDKLTILGLALGVNEVWLMGYDVSVEEEPKKEELCPQGQSTLCPFYDQCHFLRLDTPDRNRAIGYMEALLTDEKYEKKTSAS